MLFTFQGEQLNSDFLMFCPKQKAYVKLLEDRIQTLEFQLKEQVRETREKILDERK
jgi:hypothetical protein